MSYSRQQAPSASEWRPLSQRYKSQMILLVYPHNKVTRLIYEEAPTNLFSVENFLNSFICLENIFLIYISLTHWPIIVSTSFN